MQAMHGLAVKVRKRGRLVGCCAVLALALSAFVLVPASASAAVPQTYLALGDSISFGYTQEKFNLHKPNEAPAYFEEGFTNSFLVSLKKLTELGKNTVLVNDGCPGETSQGLIGENEAIGGKKSTEGPLGEQGPGDYHPCRYHNVFGFPLHNSLGTHSQLEDALVVIEKEAANLKVISLQIGSNDELASVEKCKGEVTKEFTEKFFSEQPNSTSAPGDPEDGTKFFVLNGEKAHDEKTELEALDACLGGRAEFVTVPGIITDVITAATVIDSTGYVNPIVVGGFYNPDAFVLPGSDTLQEVVNFQLKKHLEESGLKNIHWFNPMPKFNHKPGTAAQEKAAIAKYTEMCNPNVQEPSSGFDPGCEGDIHPSLLGYKTMGKLANEAYLGPALP